MPKLSALSPKQVISILEKNGFSFRRSTGSHQMFVNYQTRRRVVVPFHNKDLPKGTLLSIIKSSGLSKEDFA